jgi:hypothetical protein
MTLNNNDLIFTGLKKEAQEIEPLLKIIALNQRYSITQFVTLPGLHLRLLADSRPAGAMFPTPSGYFP